MANVLPAQKRIGLKRYFILRIISLIFLVTGVVFLITMLFFIPKYVESKLLLSQIEQEQEITAKHINKAKVNKIKKEVKHLNTLISRMDKMTDSILISILLNNIMDIAGEAIQIVSIRLSVDPSSSKIYLSGLASNREELSAFVDRLSASDQFKTINIPFDDFSKSEKTTFTLSIEI